MTLLAADGQNPSPAEPPSDGLWLEGPEALAEESPSELPGAPRAGLHLPASDEGSRLAGHPSLVYKPPRSAV